MKLCIASLLCGLAAENMHESYFCSNSSSKSFKYSLYNVPPFSSTIDCEMVCKTVVHILGIVVSCNLEILYVGGVHFDNWNIKNSKSSFIYVASVQQSHGKQEK